MSFNFTGVRHEGTPIGTVETVAGVQCYVATPQGPYARGKAVLLLTDVFGMQLENSQVRRTPASGYFADFKLGWSVAGGRFCAEWIQGAATGLPPKVNDINTNLAYRGGYRQSYPTTLRETRATRTRSPAAPSVSSPICHSASS